MLWLMINLLRYINEVETIHPGFTCSNDMLPPYPYEVVGTATAFTTGKAIICGGGRMEYVDCKYHAAAGNICDRNIECVKTTGGTRWCTGPKTKSCYAYDPLFKVSNKCHPLIVIKDALELGMELCN